MAIELMTFQGKNLTPKDHAIMRQNSQSDGVLYGCELTHLGSNQVRISSGSINIRGRQVNVSEETILCELSTSGTIDGRIYVKVDLADAVTPVELLTVAASTLPDLVQDDDFNETNGVWEMELGLYDAEPTLISNLQTTFDVVRLGQTYEFDVTVAEWDDFTTYVRADFDIPPMFRHLTSATIIQLSLMGSDSTLQAVTDEELADSALLLGARIVPADSKMYITATEALSASRTLSVRS